MKHMIIVCVICIMCILQGCAAATGALVGAALGCTGLAAKSLHDAANPEVTLDTYPACFYEYPPQALTEDKAEWQRYLKWRKLMREKMEGGE